MYVYSFFPNFSFYFITLTIHPLLLLLLYVIVIRFNYIFRNWLQNVVTFINVDQHLGIWVSIVLHQAQRQCFLFFTSQFFCNPV
jgi:hypothetical protein